MKDKTATLSEHFQNPIKDIFGTLIQDRSFSWLGTRTSINSNNKQ